MVAVDTETTSIDSVSANLVGVSLSFEPGNAIYIPLAHKSKEGIIIAEEIKQILKAEHVRVKGVSSSEFPLPAARPRSEVLRNLNLELRKIYHAKPWQEVVRHYVESEWAAT